MQRVGSGLVHATNAIWNVQNYELDTWIYVTSEFYATTRVEYYWQMEPSIAAWYEDYDPLHWTTNEPIAAFANPKIDLIGAYDPNDHTKLWDIPEEAYIGLTPRRVM